MERSGQILTKYLSNTIQRASNKANKCINTIFNTVGEMKFIKKTLDKKDMEGIQLQIQNKLT